MAKKAVFGVILFGESDTNVGELRSWNLSREANELDTSIMNAAGNARRQPGAVASSIDITAYYEDPDDAGQALIHAALGEDTPQAVKLYPHGNSSGKIEITGDVFVMTHSASGEADGSVEAEFRLTADENGFTFGTVP